MSIISSVKKFLGIKDKKRITEFREFYLKAYKAYEYRDDFLRILQQMFFEPSTNLFIRMDDNTVVYMIYMKNDMLFLFMPKSYLEEVEKFANTHHVKIVVGVDHA